MYVRPQIQAVSAAYLQWGIWDEESIDVFVRRMAPAMDWSVCHSEAERWGWNLMCSLWSDNTVRSLADLLGIDHSSTSQYPREAVSTNASDLIH